MDKQKVTAAVLWDMSKTFDSHGILLLKLQDIGLSSAALKWFSSYLFNRFQVARENSRPSSLPARVAFREKDVWDLPPKIPYWWRKSVPHLVMSANWFDR